MIPRSVREPLVFELRSYVGRRLRRRVPIDASRPVYVNLGSGEVLLDGFLNLDVFPIPLLDPRRESYFGVDLRGPLPFGDASVDGIFSEHTFEHLTYEQVARLLGECMRVLKPGGRIRLIVPDLSLFLRAYCADDRAWFERWERLYFVDSPDPERARRRLLTPMNAISFVTQEYGHLSAWDFETLRRYMEDAGFAEIRHCSYRTGEDAMLLRDLDADDRRLVSLYAEGVKR